MRDLRSLIDDTEVALVFYGSIVSLAVVSALGSQDEPPDPSGAVSAVVATASVLFIAHVFAALVPKVAKAGRLHSADLLAGLRHDVPLLISTIVSVIPLLFASWEVISIDAGYRVSVRITLAMLFGLAVMLSRRDGLPWMRAVVAGLVIVAVTAGVIWLEAQVH